MSLTYTTPMEPYPELRQVAGQQERNKTCSGGKFANKPLNSRGNGVEKARTAIRLKEVI